MDEVQSQEISMKEPKERFTSKFSWGYIFVSVIAFLGTLLLLYDSQLLAALITALISANFAYLSIKQPSKKNEQENQLN